MFTVEGHQDHFLVMRNFCQQQPRRSLKKHHKFNDRKESAEQKLIARWFLV
jgi:hypothetical protein